MRSLLYALTVLSLPLRGAWIEITERTLNDSLRMSLPLRGAWIEILANERAQAGQSSLPLRGAWIEIRNAIYS